VAIHEQNYARYEGTLRERGAAAVIAWRGFRVFFSFWKTKLIMLGMLGLPLLLTALVFVENAARSSDIGKTISEVAGQGADAIPEAGFIMFPCWMTVFGIGVLFAASGCGVLADDIRYKTFQLYFSKPISRGQYVSGKFMTLLILGSIAGFLPLALVGFLRVALFFRLTPDLGFAVLWQTVLATGLLFMTLVSMSLVVMGLSALTSQTRYVVLAWLGVLLVPMLVGTIVGLALDSQDVGNLFSITGNLWMGMSMLLEPDKSTQVPAFAPFVLLAAYGGAGAGAVAWRVNRLEGVA
jgi:ABC-type transport system involved in multi-copper enzyme maturation permease subunit